ncbi:exocyst complex component SEC10-like protein, partial [Tanacetum coccineum]
MVSGFQMKETQDDSKGDTVSRTSSFSSKSLVLDIDKFKGDFSFDGLFANLVNRLLPSFVEEDADSMEGPINIRTTKGLSSPLFPDVESLLLIFKDSCTQLVDLRKQIDGRLQKLKKDVVAQDSKHRKTLGELEKGVDGIFNCFARLDSRISSVGKTAAKIGDHLQSVDSQRETASQTMELIKLMEFNSSPGDLIQLSSLFSDDKHVAEAASIAQKLRSLAEEDIGRHSSAMQSVPGNAAAGKGLEVALTNLQEYCNELENKLLTQFDNASQRRELSNMAECAKILSQFNRGTSAMQHYVGLRPMFDVEVMNEDSKSVLGEQDSTPNPVDFKVALSERYVPWRTVVMEDRIPSLLEKLLVKPSLLNPPPTKQGGLLLYLRMLAVGYERTQELAKDLRRVGCGDLDVEGLTEALFLEHKDYYSLSVSLRKYIMDYAMQMEEFLAEGHLPSKGALISSTHQNLSVSVVTEFVSWNEEAILRCKLFSPQPANLAANAKAVFACLLDQVKQYTTEGIGRSREGLKEAASHRERFSLGRKVGAAAASAAEAAAATGEIHFRSFMVALQACGSSVAIIQQ